MFVEEPFTGQAVKAGEQVDLVGLLWQDARTTVGLHELIEQGKLPDDVIYATFDGSEGMVSGEGGIKVEDLQQVALRLRFVVHAAQTFIQPLCSDPQRTLSTACYASSSLDRQVRCPGFVDGDPLAAFRAWLQGAGIMGLTFRMVGERWTGR